MPYKLTQNNLFHRTRICDTLHKRSEIKLFLKQLVKSNSHKTISYK